LDVFCIHFLKNKEVNVLIFDCFFVMIKTKKTKIV
jgi:hypothetical protein